MSFKRSTANIDEFVTILVGVYDRHCTKQQIDQMAAFFETPLGRMMAENQGPPRSRPWARRSDGE